MKMNDALFVRIQNIRRQQEAPGNVFRYLARHIVPLGAVDGRILIGIFLLGLFIRAADQRPDLFIGRVGLTHQRALIAVGNIIMGYLISAFLHDGFFDKILNFFDRDGPFHPIAPLTHPIGNHINLRVAHPAVIDRCRICFLNRVANLIRIKKNFFTASLNDIHVSTLFRRIVGYPTIRSAP